MTYEKIEKVCLTKYAKAHRKKCEDSGVKISMKNLRQKVILKGEELYQMVMNKQEKMVDSLIFLTQDCSEYKIKVEFRTDVSHSRPEELCSKFENANALLDLLFTQENLEKKDWKDKNYIASKRGMSERVSITSAFRDKKMTILFLKHGQCLSEQLI